MIFEQRKLKAILLSLFLCSAFQVSAKPPEIQETIIVTKTMNESLRLCKTISQTAYSMSEEARPFTNPRHEARYRFAPSDQKARTVLNASRGLASRFRLLLGILGQVPMPNRDSIIKSGLESSDNLSTYAKRSLRAIKDHNHTLYLASAQGIEKEVLVVKKVLKDLEDAVNESIQESDARKEDL